jgi:diguanylate cyclase (GGDEF)-like protein/PAS domain S-box-containing protein
LKPEPENEPNGASYGAHKSTHSNGPRGEDYRWLRSVVEHSSENITIVDVDGTLRYASPAFGRMLGYAPEEVVGKMNVLDHVHPDDLPHVLEETEKALSEGGVVTNEAEYRFRHADGSWRWVESVGTYLLDDPYVGVVVQTRDVTERKETEESLRRSQAEIFSILESISDAFFALDREWRFSYVNPQAEVLFERDKEGLIGERVPEDPTFYPQYRRAVADDTTARFESYYPPLEKWFNVRAYPSQTGLSVYLQDVTERKRAEERIRLQAQLLNEVGESVIALDMEGRILYWNRAAEEMYGWVEEEVMGRHLREMVVPESLQERAEEIGAQVRHGRTWTGEFVVRRRDGATFPVEATNTPVFAEEGELIGVIGVLRNISERKQAEKTLAESEQRFRRSFEDAATGMALVGTDGRFLRVNRSLCEILGYTESELLGKTFQEITHPDDLEVDVEHLRRLLAGEIRTYQTEKRYLHQDGHVVWVLLSVSIVHDEEDEPLYFVSQIQDITERKVLEERLEHRAYHDTLTDLPNRPLLVNRLAHALERTQRRWDRQAVVLFMDLDGFKVINDSLGHEIGDHLLVLVAERLRRCLRPEDTLARFGGDEFVVLLEDVEDPSEAVRVAERIANELKRPFVMDGRSLFASVSIGIAQGNARTKSPLDLLRDADTAMYRAKSEHADYRVFDPAMYERAVKRLELENDLRRGVEDQEFVAHYQPILDLETGETWGMEALLRWKHPEQGLLEASEFMAVFEESGLAVPTGERVLEEACWQALLWQEQRPLTPPLVVCVNLSAVQLERSDLARIGAEVLGKTGLDPRHLSLDVTETAYIRILEERITTLDRLKELGVGVSIDDFGVGYSSLSYLKRLPADILKIDRSFVRGVGEVEEDTAIVRMVIDLAHTLGMKVVAEGIEEWGQATLLAEMGCDMGQGFYFSRPLSPEAVPEFLAG